MNRKKSKASYIVTQGTPYEAGYQLGKKLLTNEGLIRFMTSPFMGGPELSKEQFEKVRQLFEEYSPGLNEEIRGFADAVGAECRQVVYNFVYLQLPAGGCSHIALTPDITTDGMAYLGRNYDFGWGEDMYLLDTKIEGQYRHIGFACQLFGRFDGMNEAGLCVTTSASVVGPQYKEAGFVFPFVVRTLLGRCKDVQEAADLLNKLPMADYRNYIIMDKSGKALLVETAASEIKMQWSGVNKKALYSTNHYNLLDNEQRVYEHSLRRFESIREYLAEEQKKVSEDDLINVLSKPYPDGVCCQHYGDGMGTLWSVVMCPMKMEMKVCCGTPGHNEWNTVGFADVPMEEERTVELVSVPAVKDFWKKLN